MICLTFSTANEQLGIGGPDAMKPRADIQIAYASVSQPSQCAANQYVLMTHGEIKDINSVSLPPFQLDVAEGAQIASAILAVWAVGYGIRMLIRALHSDGKPTNESE